MRREPISYVEATIRALEEDNADLLAETRRLRAALEECEATVTAHHADNEARAKWSGSGIAQKKARAISARSGVLLHDIKTIARAALTAQPAAPEERRTGLRLVMVAATLLDQEDLPDEPSAILCGSIDAIRSLGGLLGDPVDVLPAQPAAPKGGDE